MNVQRDLFVQHHCAMAGLNASEAARRAGVPTDQAGEQAKHWMREACVKKAIAALLEEQKKNLCLDGSLALRTLAIIIIADQAEVLKYVRLKEDGIPYFADDAPEHVTKAVKKITAKRSIKRFDGEQEGFDIIDGGIQVELFDKNVAAKQLMQHLGILVPTDDPQKSAMQSLADFLKSIPKPKE